MEAITIIPKNKEEESFLKNLFEKMQINFFLNNEIAVVSESKSIYNKEFVEKIKKGEKDIKNNKIRKLDLDNLWK